MTKCKIAQPIIKLAKTNQWESDTKFTRRYTDLGLHKSSHFPSENQFQISPQKNNSAEPWRILLKKYITDNYNLLLPDWKRFK